MPGIYVWAVIQACLDLNQKSIPAYGNIVETWSESGNQSFLDECIGRGQKEGLGQFGNLIRWIRSNP